MISDALDEYFRKLLAAWGALGGLPRFPYEEDVSSPAIVRVLEDDGLVEWRPVRIAERERPEWPVDVQVHRSVLEYFSAYWFLSAGGSFGDLKVQLEPVVGPHTIDEYAASLRRYEAANGGLEHAYIGLETRSSRLLVVEKMTGEVVIREEGGRSFVHVALSFNDLIRGLTP